MMPKHRGLRRSNRRRGFTLIHAVSMVLLIGSVMSLTIVVLHKALGAHSSSLEQLQYLRNVQNFADRFRKDIHQAVAVDTPLDRSSELRIDIDAQKVVRYSIQDDRLLRTLESDEGTSQEVFPLSSEAEVSWTINRTGTIPLVTAQITPQAFEDRMELEQQATDRSFASLPRAKPFRVQARQGVSIQLLPLGTRTGESDSVPQPAGVLTSEGDRSQGDDPEKLEESP